VIIRYLYIIRIAISPVETDAPLVIDAYRVFAFAVAVQLLQAIAWWHHQIVQSRRRVEHQQFPLRHAVNVSRESRRTLSAVDLLRYLPAIALYHLRSVTYLVNGIKRFQVIAQVIVSYE
jgi:hypothetical protein